jgi:hypothetical protein
MSSRTRSRQRKRRKRASPLTSVGPLRPVRALPPRPYPFPMSSDPPPTTAPALLPTELEHPLALLSMIVILAVDARILAPRSRTRYDSYARLPQSTLTPFASSVSSRPPLSCLPPPHLLLRSAATAVTSRPPRRGPPNCERALVLPGAHRAALVSLPVVRGVPGVIQLRTGTLLDG